MKKALILFGGNSFEHEISCKSVNFIIKNIDTNLFEYSVAGLDYNNNLYKVDKYLYINKNWKNNIKEQVIDIVSYFKSFDIIFPIIHGNTLEDGKLQSLFELFNIKYVGSNSYSSLISYDKLITKILLEKYSIPQVPYYIYNKDLNIKDIKFPVIVKPCKCGSSIGISIANNKKELKNSIKKALKYDSQIIIEKFIKNNRELECAILQKKHKLVISDIGEIINNGKWYDYDSKYESKTNTVISDIDDKIKKEIKFYCSKIFKILNCSNLSRIDFLYDIENKKLYFNEINTMPGFTDISMYPKLMENEGISFKNLITNLLLL